MLILIVSLNPISPMEPQQDEISALKEANDIIRTKAKEYREQARAARAGNGNGNGNDKHEKEKPVRKTKDVVPDADEVPKATGSGLKPPRQGKRAVTPMSDDAEVVIKVSEGLKWLIAN